jgi:hypothetical protein
MELNDNELKTEIGISALGVRKLVMRAKQSLVTTTNQSTSTSTSTSTKTLSEGEIAIDASSLEFVRVLGSGFFGQVCCCCCCACLFVCLFVCDHVFESNISFLGVACQMEWQSKCSDQIFDCIWK